MDVEGGAVTRVGVALSGGGHRASVWAAGLLLYLADAGRNGDVGVIASVSGTRDRAMVALMSTKKGVFPGTPGSNTEVPRETLVTALGQRMKPMFSTMDLQPGTSHVEVAAPAFGDAPFTVVSNE
jgi:hypothetical protein